MVETNRALRSKHGGNDEGPHSVHLTSPHSVKWLAVLMLLLAGSIAGISSRAQAAPPPPNRVVTGCTFTTANLQAALNIQNLNSLNGGNLQASYIIIYVRQNPNEGQRIGTTGSSYTGPILCTNTTDAISPTAEGTVISGPVDILGAEEVSHIQYRANTSIDPNDNKKRVCHTVASNTDCFTIQKP